MTDLNSIEIYRLYGFIFEFDFSLSGGIGDLFSLLSKKDRQCVYCKSILDEGYIFIINKLKEADLLDKKFKLVCCFCNFLQKFGIPVHWRNKLLKWKYNDKDDIFTLTFITIGIGKNHDSYIPFISHQKTIEIRIHEWKKVSVLMI